MLAQIREADRRKDDFLAMLAHELRNPLAPLRSAVDLQLMMDEGGETERELREVMDRQISHMGRIIDDLLDVSRLTRGRIELRREKLDFTKLIADGLAAHRRIFESGQYEIRSELPDAPIWIDGDSTRLSQVLDNLLSNARKFTDAGGTITVRLTADGSDSATLEVCDTGIGVAGEDLGRIFEIFTQADRSLDRRRGGLGLGLALVKGLVELHGGQVSAHSEGLGQGCSIGVKLPLAEAPAENSTDEEIFLTSKTPLRVLIIEDNRDAAETLRMLLDAHGFQTAVASDGRSGVELVSSFAPQAIVCDIGLPELDGFEVARVLRTDSAYNDIRLIALTGYGRDADVARAHEAGFDEHLTKPADARRLLGILAEVGRFVKTPAGESVGEPE
ncbi:MAG: ATP-binding protein [Pirellulales bacterium]